MPPVPPNQVSPFPEGRRPDRRCDPEPRLSEDGMVGRPRGPPPDSARPLQPRVLRTPDAARYLGLTSSTLEKMRLTGAGPHFIRLGARAVGYAFDDLDEFVDAGRRSSTSDPGVGRRQCRETQSGAVS
jgi:predicted DNA-binding transcriptional regulator AlpA